jgi:hypothetical protein
VLGAARESIVQHAEVGDGSPTRLFPYDRWQTRLPALVEEYRRGEPFPHVHLTDFLDDAVVRGVVAEFPGPGDGSWTQYKHYNERKLGRSQRGDFPPHIGRVVDELNSPAFCAWLSALTGIPGLLADPLLEGGGLHQTERGGFLRMHTDFSMHHYHRGWRRRVNLILFLNEGWQDEWRGAIEFWDRGMKRCVRKVSPLLNHAVVFDLTDASFHGYPDALACPPGVTRKSLALYYYTRDDDPHAVSRATNYRARPGDGPRAAALIWLDKTALALYSRVKTRLGISDAFVSRILGKLGR